MKEAEPLAGQRLNGGAGARGRRRSALCSVGTNRKSFGTKCEMSRETAAEKKRTGSGVECEQDGPLLPRTFSMWSVQTSTVGRRFKNPSRSCAALTSAACTLSPSGAAGDISHSLPAGVQRLAADLHIVTVPTYLSGLLVCLVSPIFFTGSLIGC